MDAITYPCWDYSKTKLVKGAPDSVKIFVSGFLWCRKIEFMKFGWLLVLSQIVLAFSMTSETTGNSAGFQANNKNIIKAAHYWPLVWQSTGDRLVPLTKGQKCRNISM